LFPTSRAIVELNRAALDATIDEWSKIPTSTTPMDVQASEAAIRQLYHEAGLPSCANALEVRFADDPVAMVHEASVERKAGPVIQNRLQCAAMVNLDLLIDRELWLKIHHRVHSRFSRSRVTEQIWELINTETLTRRPRPHMARRIPDCILPTYVTSSLVIPDVAGKLAGAALPLGTQALLTLARSCGLVLPRQSVCWLSERPAEMHFNEQGLFNHPDVPAVRFHSGLKFCYWHGARVPADVMIPRESITVALVKEQGSIFLARLLIERMGIGRFIRESGALLASQDRTGRLFVEPLINSLGDQLWAAVEVVNGTPEPDGTYCRYYLQVPPQFTHSARAAVAWTYGLRPEDYVVTVRT